MRKKKLTPLQVFELEYRKKRAAKQRIYYRKNRTDILARHARKYQEEKLLQNAS